MKQKYISLSTPSLQGNELKYVTKCIKDEWISTSGELINKFENKIAQYMNSKYAIACVNGTSAIHISLLLSGVKFGDEVIVPTLTFIAPVNAIKYCNASPIFMDCNDDHNINIDKTIDFIKKNTFFKKGFTYNKKTKAIIRAIIPVHVWGNAIYFDKLVSICKKYNIAIIEDASEALGTFYTKGKFKNKYVGTIGQFGCLSFNGNKIITTGGGGMILTQNKSLAKKAYYLTQQAKNNSIFFIHNEIGFNYRLTNMQAALGLAQLEQLNKFIVIKRKIHTEYANHLKNKNRYEILKSPSHSNNNYWLNIIQIKKRDKYINIKNIIKIFKINNIEIRPLWKLNHTQKPYLNNQNFDITIAKELIKSCFCVPSSINLNIKDIKKIIDLLP